MREQRKKTEVRAKRKTNANSLASSSSSRHPPSQNEHELASEFVQFANCTPPLKGGNKQVRFDFLEPRDVTEDGTAGSRHSPPVRPSSGDKRQTQIIDDFAAFTPPTTTAQQKGEAVTRSGKIRHYERAGVALARKTLTIAMAAMRPEIPFAGPTRASVEWVRPWLASDSPKARTAGKIPHPSRPDADNLAKLLLDVLTSLKFWTDDNLVTTLIIAKRRGGLPGISLRVEPDMASTPAQELACYHGAVSRFCALMRLTPDVPGGQKLAAELAAFCRWMEDRQRQAEAEPGRQPSQAARQGGDGWRF